MKQQQRHSLALAAVLVLTPLAAQGQAQAPVAAARGAQAAHAAADAGYKAYARKDYAAAAASAQRAVQLAPGRRDYWLLLAQAQLAEGRTAEAGQTLQRAARAPGDDAALARARADWTRASAQAAGEAMYKALAAGELATAVAQGSEAVRLAPQNTTFRLVLTQALLRANRKAEAERAATEVLALLPGSAAALGMRAVARQGLNRPAEANADLDRALQQPALAANAQRQLRLLGADLALAQGDGARALALLGGLPGDDAAAATRREYAQQRLAGNGAARYTQAPPGIDCSQAEAAQGCLLQAAAAPPVPGFVHATAAYRALEQRDLERALVQARLATQAAPGRRDWKVMHMNAALAAGQPAEAERAASAALALGVDPLLLAQRSSIRRSLGNEADADADAEAALQAGPLPPDRVIALLVELGRKREARQKLAQAPPPPTPAANLDRAYLSTRVGDDEAARQAFARADAGGALPPRSLLDAGYTAMRSHQDAEAVGYFRRAVDAVYGLELQLAPQMVYDTRRTIADVSRKWGVLASLTVRNGGGVQPGVGLVGGGGPRVTQTGAEAYYRPWGFRNGRFVELFVRGFGTLDDQNGGPTGSDTFQGGLGVRWKPLTAHNLVLSLSRVFGPNVTEDWLAQVGYSWDHGTDLRVDRQSWWTTRLYAEVGRYLEGESHYGVAQAMVGRSYLMGGDGRTVLFPHGFVGVEYSSVDPVARTSAGAGPGVSLRRWFREDAYNAPRSYWDVTVQYRARLAGDDRMRGLFVNGLLSY